MLTDKVNFTGQNKLSNIIKVQRTNNRKCFKSFIRIKLFRYLWINYCSHIINMQMIQTFNRLFTCFHVSLPKIISMELMGRISEEDRSIQTEIKEMEIYITIKIKFQLQSLKITGTGSRLSQNVFSNLRGDTELADGISCFFFIKEM